MYTFSSLNIFSTATLNEIKRTKVQVSSLYIHVCNDNNTIFYKYKNILMMRATYLHKMMIKLSIYFLHEVGVCKQTDISKQFKCYFYKYMVYIV